MGSGTAARENHEEWGEKWRSVARRCAELEAECDSLQALNKTLLAEADTDLRDVSSRINADLAKREYELRREVERLRGEAERNAETAHLALEENERLRKNIKRLAGFVDPTQLTDEQEAFVRAALEEKA